MKKTDEIKITVSAQRKNQLKFVAEEIGVRNELSLCRLKKIKKEPEQGGWSCSARFEQKKTC